MFLNRKFCKKYYKRTCYDEAIKNNQYYTFF